MGAFEPVTNEMVYYYNGSIRRASRATNATLATTVVTGLPVALSNTDAASRPYRQQQDAPPGGGGGHGGRLAAGGSRSYCYRLIAGSRLIRTGK